MQNIQTVKAYSGRNEENKAKDGRYKKDEKGSVSGKRNGDYFSKGGDGGGEVDAMTLRNRKAAAAYAGGQGKAQAQGQVGSGASVRVKTKLPQLAINDAHNPTPQKLGSYKNNQVSLAPVQPQPHQLSHRTPSGQGSTATPSAAAANSAGGAAKNSLAGLGGNNRTRNTIGMAFQQQHHTTTGAGVAAQRLLRQPDGSYHQSSSKGFRTNLGSFNDELMGQGRGQGTPQQSNQLSSRGAPTSNIYGGGEPLAQNKVQYRSGAAQSSQDAHKKSSNKQMGARKLSQISVKSNHVAAQNPIMMMNSILPPQLQASTPTPGATHHLNQPATSARTSINLHPTNKQSRPQGTRGDGAIHTARKNTVTTGQRQSLRKK